MSELRAERIPQITTPTGCLRGQHSLGTEDNAQGSHFHHQSVPVDVNVRPESLVGKHPQRVEVRRLTTRSMVVVYGVQ